MSDSQNVYPSDPLNTDAGQGNESRPDGAFELDTADVAANASVYADPGGDYLVRATAMNDRVRLVGIRTTDLCNEAMRVHDLSPTATVALGRLMTGVLMMTPDLHDPDDSITAVVRGDGPLGGLTVIGQAEGRVRGLVIHPVVPTQYKDQGKLDIGAAVGQGRLTVIRDLGLKEPYIGHVSLVSGEIAEDLTAYLAYSEQIPTVIGLGVRLDQNGVTHAGGFMLQLMPGADEAMIEHLEARVGGFPDVSYLLAEGFNPHQILDLLMGDPNIRYHDVIACRYDCNCSRERMKRNLVALGRTELTELGLDPEGIELVCHFCDGKYHFPQDEIQELLADD